MPNVLKDELRRGPYRRDQDRSRGTRSTPYDVYGRDEEGQGDRDRWDRDYNRGDRGYARQYDQNRIQERGYDTRYGTNKNDTGYYEYVEEWYIPGPFTGVGPTSYHRSDENILEDVCERLMQHGLVDARNMRVEVQNGEVTLDGTVNSRREKRMAEDTAKSVTGVNDVHNRLRVSTGETESTGQT